MTAPIMLYSFGYKMRHTAGCLNQSFQHGMACFHQMLLNYREGLPNSGIICGFKVRAVAKQSLPDYPIRMKYPEFFFFDLPCNSVVGFRCGEDQIFPAPDFENAVMMW